MSKWSEVFVWPNIGYISYNDYLSNTWEPEERYVALVEGLELYYKLTSGVGDLTAGRYYREFKEWARACGYTHQEITRAKGVARHE